MRKAVAGLILAGVLLAGGAIAQQKKQAEIDLQAAIRKEAVDGDLKGAIDRYKKIIGANRNNHEIAAKALVQLGECYEKLGDAEAKKAYGQVLSDYADQKELAATARTRLAALGGAAKPTGMNARQITGLPFTPDGVSPDGRYIVQTYQENDWTVYGLEVFDKASGQARKISVVPQPERINLWLLGGQTVFSPDSRQIAYLRMYIDGDEAFWKQMREKYDPEGAYSNKLLASLITDLAPRSHGQLRLVNPDGSSDRLVAQFGDNRMLIAGWLPDGKSVMLLERPGELPPDAIASLAATGVKIPVDQGPPRLLRVAITDGAVTRVAELPALQGKAELSPDGKFVAYRVTTQQKPVQADIRVLSLADSSDVPLGLPAANYRQFEWTPDSRGMVVLSDRRGTDDLWYTAIANGKAQGELELIKSEMPEPLFPITAGGAYYYQQQVRQSAILTAEIDPATGKVTSAPAPLERLSEGDKLLAGYSPDGSMLAYWRTDGRRDSHFTLVLHSVAGGGEQIIPTSLSDSGDSSTAVAQGIAWSADQRYIYVGGFDTANRAGLFRLQLAGGAMTLALDLTTAAEWPIASAPLRNGRLLLARAANKQARLSVLDAATGQERDLFQTPFTSGSAALRPSPDEQRLAVVSDQGHAIEVMSMTGADRREIYRVAAPDSIGNVRWFPDGQSLMAIVWPGGEYRRIPAVGGEAQTILRAIDGMSNLQISPDGRHLAFQRTLRTNETWALENFIPRLKTSK